MHNSRDTKTTMFAAAVTLSMLLGCGQERAGEPTADAPSSPGSTTAGTTPLVIAPSEIINNPAAWVGRRVTVAGDVEEVWTPHAFNMDSGVTAGELLVISKEPFPTLQDHDPLVDDVATVTGTVRLLVTAEIEREIGWDLQPEIETEFSGKPVLIVDNSEFRKNQPTGTTAAGAPIPDLLIIVDDPNRISLAGRQVRLTDVKVLRVAGDRSFLIGPNESRSLLAVLAAGLDQPPLEEIVDVNKNEIRTMTGEIRRASDGQRQLNLKKEDAAALAKAGVYLHVTSIELKKR